MELKVFNLKSEVIGKENADDSIFKAKHQPSLLHDYVVMQRRALRQGTHSTLTRAEVSGTGKKPFKQKGTGQARQGTLIGPHQPGGGIQFGPKPRDYTTKLNKKTKAQAIRVALSEKVHKGKLAIIDSFEIASGKTKDAYKALVKFSPKSALVVGTFSSETRRSVQNLTDYKVLAPIGLNVFDLLVHDQILITKEALQTVTDKLKKIPRANANAKKVQKVAA